LWNLILKRILLELHARNIPAMFNKFGQLIFGEKLFKEIDDARTHARTMDKRHCPQVSLKGLSAKIQQK
jgi:hypothetical protein